MNKFLTEELKLPSNKYVYQTNELLMSLLPHLEKQDRFEDCIVIQKILEKRKEINFK